MCGLVGILRRDSSDPVSKNLLEAMNALIAHRGPDDGGFYLDGEVGLGHRRLSVIDIAGGHQPMVDTERGRALAYNGEIFNYRRLRQQLTTAEQSRLATNSDTEVLLKLVDFESFDWLERLNGMFAFAVWDSHTRRLLLARDRLGVKPLYYVDLGDELVFASEVKALLRHPRVRPKLNSKRVAEYLAFRSLVGVETLFEGIKQVPPGHVLLAGAGIGSPRILSYWREGRERELDEYVDPGQGFVDQLEALLRDSVRERLVSDVPVGSFNSGGVDSSLVTALMKSLTQGELHTFSVGFEDPRYDERPYAERVAERLGTRHHSLVVTECEFADAFERALWHADEPLCHANTIQLMLLSEYARQFVTVVLTGEGSDEVFGGYPRLQIPLLAEYLAWLPWPIKRGAAVVAGAAGLRRIEKLLSRSRDVREAIVTSAQLLAPAELDHLVGRVEALTERFDLLENAERRSTTGASAMLYFEQRSYLQPLLMRLDKSSMASALECRTPFLDYRIVEWSYKIPDSVKLRVGTDNKRIVKQVAERHLPADIVYRAKSGFGSPLADWLRNPRTLGRYLDVITDTTARQRGLVSAAAVDALVQEHRAGSKDHSEALWGLINLELWHRRFLDAPASEGGLA